MGDVVDLERKTHSRMRRTGELRSLRCPFCKVENSFVPIVGAGAQGMYIAHLMCLSRICKGNTICTIENGILGETYQLEGK